MNSAHLLKKTLSSKQRAKDNDMDIDMNDIEIFVRYGHMKKTILHRSDDDSDVINPPAQQKLDFIKESGRLIHLATVIDYFIIHHLHCLNNNITVNMNSNSNVNMKIGGTQIIIKDVKHQNMRLLPLLVE